MLHKLTQELKSLNGKQKPTAEKITERIVDIEKTLVSLQITVDGKHTDPDDNSSRSEFKLLQKQIR